MRPHTSGGIPGSRIPCIPGVRWAVRVPLCLGRWRPSMSCRGILIKPCLRRELTGDLRYIVASSYCSQSSLIQRPPWLRLRTLLFLRLGPLLLLLRSPRWIIRMELSCWGRSEVSCEFLAPSLLPSALNPDCGAGCTGLRCTKAIGTCTFHTIREMRHTSKRW